jgi:hypothetical protein
MFTADRDLVVLEPAVFRDAAHLSQVLYAGTCALDLTQVLTNSAPPESAEITSGGVALIDGVAMEIVQRAGEREFGVSLPRPDRGALLVAWRTLASAKIEIRGFSSMIAVVHRRLMADLGMSPGGPHADVEIGAVMNPEDWRNVETLGTLSLIYTAAAAMRGSDDPLWSKAEHYRREHAAARRRLVVRIDRDGDGVADVELRVQTGRLTRE